MTISRPSKRLEEIITVTLVDAGGFPVRSVVHVELVYFISLLTSSYYWHLIRRLRASSSDHGILSLVWCGTSACWWVDLLDKALLCLWLQLPFSCSVPFCLLYLTLHSRWKARVALLCNCGFCQMDYCLCNSKGSTSSNMQVYACLQYPDAVKNGEPTKWSY